MWAWIKRNAEALEALAACGTMLFALFAGIVAYMQLSSHWQIEAEKSAKESYREFMVKSLEYPHLANPHLKSLNDTEHEQYIWFVGLMSAALEEIVRLFPDGEWAMTGREMIALHCNYFSEGGYAPSLYTQEFQELVTEGLSLINTAECKGTQ